MLHLLRNSIVLAAATVAVGTLPADTRSTVSERVKKLTRDSSWNLVASVPISFRTHHPQGMVKIGDRLIVSSVEKRVPTKGLTQIVDGYDRDAGEDQNFDRRREGIVAVARGDRCARGKVDDANVVRGSVREDPLHPGDQG